MLNLSELRGEMSRWYKTPLLACLVLLAAHTPAAANSGPKWPIAELAAFADVIAIGRVTRVAGGWDPAVTAIYTYVSVTVEEVIKGPIGPGPIIIKQLGGETGDTRLEIFDQPSFADGERVLLYLEARPRDGSLYTSSLWQGKWTVEVIGGDLVATRMEPPGHRSAFPVDRQLISAVRLQGASSRVAAAALDTTPPDAALGASAGYSIGLPEPFRYVFSPVVDVQAGGLPGLPGGGGAEVQSAIAKWNAAGSSFRYALGSLNGPSRCAFERLNNSRVTIVFNDPCGEISNRGGTLAIGGSYFSLIVGSGGVVNGLSFFAATEGFVINNDSETALRILQQPNCFADVQLHELGHVLGLNHSSDSTAIMFPSISPTCSSSARNLAPDDIAGLQFIYPPTSGGPNSSLVPSRVQVGVNGTTSITVSFDPVGVPGAPAAAGISYRLDFRQAQGGPVVTSVVTTSTVNVLPLAPGTLGAFTVTVSAISAAGAGPPSAPVAFTIGSGPVVFRNGDGGPCTAPPAAPVLSGAVVNDMAMVMWASVGGAASYVLSAGTSIGATNLYPVTDIGLNNVATATGLAPGFAAWVRVRAVNACGQSAPTDFFLQ